MERVVLFLWQGAIYLGAGFLAPFLSAELLTEISIIGGILMRGGGEFSGELLEIAVNIQDGPQ